MVLYRFFFVSLPIVLHGMCKPAFGMKTSRLPWWTQILNIPHTHVYIYICINIYIYNPKLDSTLSLTERFAVTDYLCQYQVAPGHDWQMHLSPSTRYGRLANGFLVGFKPHAGFSFPTTLMSFPWQGYQWIQRVQKSEAHHDHHLTYPIDQIWLNSTSHSGFGLILWNFVHWESYHW